MHQCSNDELFVLPVYKVSTSDIAQRELKEKLLIKLLKPGLNSYYDVISC